MTVFVMKDRSQVGAGALGPSTDHGTISPFSTGVKAASASPIGAQVTASTTVRLDQAVRHVRTGGAAAHGLAILGRLHARRAIILALFSRVEVIITATCMIMIGTGRRVRAVLIGAYHDTIGALALGTTIAHLDARGREMAGRFFALDHRRCDFWSVVWRPHAGAGDKGPQDLTSEAVTGSHSIRSGDALGAQIAVIGSARIMVRSITRVSSILSKVSRASESGKKDQLTVGAMTLGQSRVMWARRALRTRIAMVGSTRIVIAKCVEARVGVACTLDTLQDLLAFIFAMADALDKAAGRSTGRRRIAMVLVVAQVASVVRIVGTSTDAPGTIRGRNGTRQTVTDKPRCSEQLNTIGVGTDVFEFIANVHAAVGILQTAYR
jgi:hypothetical protein